MKTCRWCGDLLDNDIRAFEYFCSRECFDKWHIRNSSGDHWMDTIWIDSSKVITILPDEQWNRIYDRARRRRR